LSRKRSRVGSALRRTRVLLLASVLTACLSLPSSSGAATLLEPPPGPVSPGDILQFSLTLEDFDLENATDGRDEYPAFGCPPGVVTYVFDWVGVPFVAPLTPTHAEIPGDNVAPSAAFEFAVQVDPELNAGPVFFVDFTVVAPCESGASFFSANAHFGPYSVEAPDASGEADLSVLKEASSASVPVGELVTYTLTVTNGGPDAAENVMLTDILPAGATFESADAPCAHDAANGLVTCELGEIADGASVVKQIRVTASEATQLVNRAAVTSSTGDPDDIDASDSVTTQVNEPPPSPDERALAIVIDEDSIDNGNQPNLFSGDDVNEDLARPGLRSQLPFFAANVEETIVLYTGQVGDEGWFALTSIPEAWAAAGPTTSGLRNYVGDPVGPGLGTGRKRESLLDKIPGVTPLRAAGLSLLEGRTVCAVVYDNDVSVNYDPLTGSLKGATLGRIAFRVGSVVPLVHLSSSSLPGVTIEILDADSVCGGPLGLFTDAPAPISSSAPFDTGR